MGGICYNFPKFILSQVAGEFFQMCFRFCDSEIICSRKRATPDSRSVQAAPPEQHRRGGLHSGRFSLTVLEGEVQGQGADSLVRGGGSPPDGRQLPPCCALTRWRQTISVLSLVRLLIPRVVGANSWTDDFPETQILSRWGLGPQHRNSGGTQTFGPQQTSVWCAGTPYSSRGQQNLYLLPGGMLGEWDHSPHPLYPAFIPQARRGRVGMAGVACIVTITCLRGTRDPASLPVMGLLGWVPPFILKVPPGANGATVVGAPAWTLVWRGTHATPHCRWHQPVPLLSDGPPGEGQGGEGQQGPHTPTNTFRPPFISILFAIPVTFL